MALRKSVSVLRLGKCDMIALSVIQYVSMNPNRQDRSQFQQLPEVGVFRLLAIAPVGADVFPRAVWA
jgi:hypothetical protein